MREWRVHEQRPQYNEGDVGLELHAVRNRTGDQCGRDDGEHRLEHHEDRVRDGYGLWVNRVWCDAVHKSKAEATDDAGNQVARVYRCEREAVPEHCPDHANQSERDEGHHHHVEGVLGADQATVEERQAGCHQHDQGARGKHPGGVAGVDLWRIGCEGSAARDEGECEASEHSVSGVFHAFLPGTTGGFCHLNVAKYTDALLECQ